MFRFVQEERDGGIQTTGEKVKEQTNRLSFQAAEAEGMATNSYPKLGCWYICFDWYCIRTHWSMAYLNFRRREFIIIYFVLSCERMMIRGWKEEGGVMRRYSWCETSRKRLQR